MAKLWEVLQAFDAGTSVKAKRSSVLGSVYIKREEDGLNFYLENGKKCEDQGFTNIDLNADWEILEKSDRQVFTVLYATFKVQISGKSVSLSSVAYHSESLLSVQQILNKQYPDAIISVLSAVGVSKPGAITILVQEGKMV